MREAIQIRVVEKIWNDSYVAMVDGSPEVYGWRKLAKEQTKGATVIWDVAKPLGYDDEVRYTNAPTRS
jgi:hypothetical protein